MILASLAVLLCIAPASAPKTGPETAPETAPSLGPSSAPASDGNLILSGSSDTSVTVRDKDGRVAASVLLHAGQTVPLTLPSGEYTVAGDYGNPFSVTLADKGEVRLRMVDPPPVQTPMATSPARSPAQPSPAAGSESEAQAKTRTCGGGPCRKWKRIAAPLMSAAMPGTGQLVNNEPGKGIGMFLGALALGGGAAALHYTRDPLDASSPGLEATTFGSEAVNGAGFGMLTGGLAMLYAAQIMDAYASAAGKETPTPAKNHRVGFQLTRMATVGFRAGDPAAAFYADWNLNFLVQVRRRLSVGLTDIGLKYGVGRTTFQTGARLHYRFYDRGRLWIGAGLGTILQGTVGRLRRTIGEDAPPEVRANAFAAIPYGQLDLRLFLLDRWSLDVIPRISVPLGTRFYRDDLALPTHSVTFELGTGVGVYF